MIFSQDTETLYCIVSGQTDIFLNSLRPGDIYISVSWVITGSGNGLPMWQAITWTNDDWVYSQLDHKEQISIIFQFKAESFCSQKMFFKMPSWYDNFFQVLKF